MQLIREFAPEWQKLPWGTCPATERAPVVIVVTVILATTGWASGQCPWVSTKTGPQAETLGPRPRALLGIRTMPARPSLWQRLGIGKTGWQQGALGRQSVLWLAILCPDMLRQKLASPSAPEGSLDLLKLKIRQECACLASLGLSDSQELTVLRFVSLRVEVIFLAY